MRRKKAADLIDSIVEGEKLDEKKSDGMMVKKAESHLQQAYKILDDISKGSGPYKKLAKKTMTSLHGTMNKYMDGVKDMRS